MATNQLLTISMVTGRAAAILSNSLQLAKCVDRSFDEDFQVKGAQIGLTVNVRKPPRYDIRSGEVVNIQASTETYAPLTFTVPVGVDLAFTSTERSFSIDDYEKRFLKPAAVRVANHIDYLGYSLMSQVPNIAGTPGTAQTTATARQAVLDAIARLYANDAPIEDGEMSAINSPGFNSTLTGSNAALFNPVKEVSEMYIRGLQGDFGGAKHYMSQNVPSYTVGVYGGAPKVDGAGQTGSALVTKAWTATTTTLNAGDVITIAGCYAVNPQTKAVLDFLQPFVLTAASTTDGAGASTLALAPAIVTSGSSMNVSAGPADNAVISVITGASGSAHQQSVVFHKSAFMMANKELELPPNVEASYVKDEESNVGIRIATQWDVRTNQLITRLDCMVAWAVLYPQLANRIVTN